MSSRIVFLMLLVAAILPLKATDLGSAKWGCKLDVPDDWWVRPPEKDPGNTLNTYGHNKADTETVALLVFPTKSADSIEQTEYVKNFLISLGSGALTITDKSHMKVGANDFYVITAFEKHASYTSHWKYCLTMADGFIYEVDLTSNTDEVSKIPSLVDALNSFALVPRP